MAQAGSCHIGKGPSQVAIGAGRVRMIEQCRGVLVEDVRGMATQPAEGDRRDDDSAGGRLSRLHDVGDQQPAIVADGAQREYLVLGSVEIEHIGYRQRQYRRQAAPRHYPFQIGRRKVAVGAVVGADALPGIPVPRIER